jgi:dsRNA-specific ribonuclease/HKD family nuclease
MGTYTDKPAEWSFHFTPWEAAFLSRVHLAKRLVRIACPFIKLRNTRLILACLSEVKGAPIHLQVLTRLNARDCRSQVHDVAAIQLLLDNPVRTQCSIDLRMDNSLHAKVYIFDDEEAIVSSSNLTYAGFYRNLEVALATTRADTVQSVVAHFSELFHRAQRISQNEITDIRKQLRTLLPIAPESYLDSQPEVVTDRSAEDSLASLRLNSTTLETIEGQLEARLEEDLSEGLLPLGPESPETLAVDRIAEHRFIEDMQLRTRTVFGEPFPSEQEVSTIFSHKSAYPYLRAAVPDDKWAGIWTLIGSKVLDATIAILVLRGTRYPSGGGLITAKTNYIYSSNHILRQLNDRGMSRVIVGPMSGGEQGSAAARRGISKMAREVATRLIAYLFTTRNWSEYVSCVENLLRIEEEFPFESYREENSKSRLQEFCQRDYDASPKYECTGREGPDHDTRFTVAVWGGKKHTKLLATGQGPTMKEAEYDAAYQALSSFSRPALDGLPGVESPPWPDWFHEKCRYEGRIVLKRMCGKDFSDAVCEAVLIPFKQDDLKIKCMRTGLAAAGGRLRELMACFHLSSRVGDHEELCRRVGAFNNNARLIQIVLDTPLGDWLRALAKTDSFADATQAGPVIDTLNCLIGALVVHHGFEACKSIEAILFSQADVAEPAGAMPARGKLQKTVQAALRGRATDLMRIESRPLHKPEEAHNPRFEVTVFLGDTKLGQGVAGKKKMAIEAACVEALANPCLQDTLDKLVAGRE